MNRGSMSKQVSEPGRCATIGATGRRLTTSMGKEKAMKCGSKGMKKGGSVSAGMISPRKAMAMGMKAAGGKSTKKGAK